MNDSIRIGSRGSQLALWQANHIADLLRAAGYSVEIEVIRTTGDRMQQPGFTPPPGLDGKGIFIKEIEEALAAGAIDLAVHSLKDLPTALAPQFTLAAIPERADARDAFVCEPYWALHTLPYGGRVGTTSPRRQAQLLALRPDLQFVPLRGNIDTRLRKLEAGEADALVLAAAGLDRLNRAEWVHQRFSPDELCPAPGQGALAIEARAFGHPATGKPNPDRDAGLLSVLGVLDHAPTRFAVSAERAVLNGLGGGCDLPLGAFCEKVGEIFRLYAQVLAPDGETIVQLTLEAACDADPCELGTRAAEELIAQGALDLLRQSEPAD